MVPSSLTGLRLHWSPKSPYVRKVMMCAMELGLDEHLDLTRSVAAMLKPNASLMRDNPLSKIPTLVRDDAEPLFDSRVICEYLNHCVHGQLFPQHGEARWQALRWQAFGDGLLDALILWRNEREREVPLEKLMEAFKVKVDASLNLLESEAQALAQAPFHIGSISIACALGYMDYRFCGESWRQERPYLQAWHQHIAERTSYQKTQPIDG
jgi:glutathione S-transferase